MHTHDLNGGRLLDDVFDAMTPILAAVAASADPPAARIGDVEIKLGDPLAFRCRVEDAAGAARIFTGAPYGPPGDALAAALGPLVEDGLNRLPASMRALVGPALEQGGALVVQLDPTFGLLTVQLEIGAERSTLTTLAVGDGASH
jgi:hypothetical protein